MANKTIIVDPNSIDGNDSSFNVPVPLEDLNISVQLETNRKARTVLTATKEAGSAQSTGGSCFFVLVECNNGALSSPVSFNQLKILHYLLL